ncbi:MAG: aldose 1-epimerase family protein [Planctomycetota bacterium]
MEKLITCTAANVSTDDGIVLQGNGADQWSITKKTLVGGVQTGVELLIVDNGLMQITIILTRGMSVLDIQWNDIRIGWDSPVKQVVHPNFVNLEDQGGLGWLSGFNELMVRCGVAFAGHPGDDNGEFLTLHGRIGNLPASRVEVSFEEAPEPTIRVRGLVEEKRFKFGVFELWTELATVVGSDKITIHDRLTNPSEYSQEYQLIYHTNFGRPFLEQDAQFVAPVKTLAPLNEYAAEDLATFQRYLGPTSGYGEQVYCATMLADPQHWTTTMLHNADASLGVAVGYDVQTLPYFNLWKNTDTERDGFVTGLEPATGFPYNRSVERAGGRVNKIGAGQSVDFSMSLQALTADGVAATNTAIQSLMGDRKTKLIETLASEQ